MRPPGEMTAAEWKEPAYSTTCVLAPQPLSRPLPVVFVAHDLVGPVHGVAAGDVRGEVFPGGTGDLLAREGDEEPEVGVQQVERPFRMTAVHTAHVRAQHHGGPFR